MKINNKNQQIRKTITLASHQGLNSKFYGLCLLALLPLPALCASTEDGRGSSNGYYLPFQFAFGSDPVLEVDFSDGQYGNSAYTQTTSECKPGNTCLLYMEGGRYPDFGSNLDVTVRVISASPPSKSATVTLKPEDRVMCEKQFGGQLGVSLEYHSSTFSQSIKALKYCYIQLFLSEDQPGFEMK
jgi:hypothetical protein